MNISSLWQSKSEDEWKEALENYWSYVKPVNMELEKRMDQLDPLRIKNMTTEEFYTYLYNEYFVWKYTAPNRLATTRKCLSKYINENRLEELSKIKIKLFEFDLNVIEEGLKSAKLIYGLGVAGASGLLSLLFPRHFGTVDQFVVYALREVDGLPEKTRVVNMISKNKSNQEVVNLNIEDGIVLIRIMRNKANELNSIFNTKAWTPRAVDKILWSSRQ